MSKLLDGYKGMAFGLPAPDWFTYRSLALGKSALMALPRPPFDCTWRPAVAYELPLTRLQTLRHIIKQRLRLLEFHNVFGAPQGFYYDEWIYGAWITNVVLTTKICVYLSAFICG
ncbi:MAG: hypothetical protein FJ398_07775 [Verrucomicrobia bacterium]|nr:hypothetical protein [Verrucomicrobiota bacterium]